MVNHTVVARFSLVEVERLLAHKGGHAVLHARVEAMSALKNDRSTSGLAMLRGVASVAIEESRVERRVSDLSYPMAGLTTTDSLDERLFDFGCTIAEATRDPASDDVVMYANRVLIAQHRLTISLSYLAAAVIVGQVDFAPDELPQFSRPYWMETFDPSWRARLDLYRRIRPPAPMGPLSRLDARQTSRRSGTQTSPRRWLHHSEQRHPARFAVSLPPHREVRDVRGPGAAALRRDRPSRRRRPGKHLVQISLPNR